MRRHPDGSLHRTALAEAAADAPWPPLVDRPRLFRFHIGAGGSGISTGAGPVSYYKPISGGAGGETSRSQ
ncbi:MAG TPA: hypothetical protein VHJ18_00295 [Streptosporangiaceae bacterium]|nr:hypothetical protein [Streptosporangiaceae bacterium]